MVSSFTFVGTGMLFRYNRSHFQQRDEQCETTRAHARFKTASSGTIGRFILRLYMLHSVCIWPKRLSLKVHWKLPHRHTWPWGRCSSFRLRKWRKLWKMVFTTNAGTSTPRPQFPHTFARVCCDLLFYVVCAFVLGTGTWSLKKITWFDDGFFRPFSWRLW